MAAYCLVYGFGHLQADCRGRGSDPEPTFISSMGLPLPLRPKYSNNHVHCLDKLWKTHAWVLPYSTAYSHN